MDADRWRRVNELFHAALERDSAERPTYLERACGDDGALRREVESLLRSHADADEFIEKPAFLVADELLLGDARPPRSPESLIGDTVGPYSIQETLGAGGMGVVYLAEDTRLRRKVALKALAEHLVRDRRSRDRLRREAQAAAALSHPAIATVYALEEIDDRLFIAYEYADGPTLRRELCDGPLPVERLRDTALAIGGALEAAHARGIVHRDLKPENVIRTASGAIKVLDFGLATLPQPALVADADGSGERLTLPGMLIGTPSYMSPEQLQGKDADFRSDLFAFGILLSELATGVHPFEGANTASTIARILEVPPRGPAAGGDARGDGLAVILRRLLAKRPEERFDSTSEVVEALRGLEDWSVAPFAPSVPAAPAARPRDPFWWWRFHQLAMATTYGATLFGLWLANRYTDSGDWAAAGLMLLYAGVAMVIVAGSLRLHLAFAARYYPDQLPVQVQRAARWIRPAEFCYGAILLAGALLLGTAHPLPAALMVAAAAGIVVFTLNIEPATTRAAFPPR